MRRAFLDVTGLLPIVKETKHFLADTVSNKRAVLIDRLLGHKQFADNYCDPYIEGLRHQAKARSIAVLRASEQEPPMNSLFSKKIREAKGSL